MRWRYLVIYWKSRVQISAHILNNFSFFAGFLMFSIIKPTRCTNFTNLFFHETTCFGQFLCPSSGVYSLYTRQWYMSYKFVDSFRAGQGLNCSYILVLLVSCLQTCMTYTIAECTVNKLLMMDRGNVRNM